MIDAANDRKAKVLYKTQINNEILHQINIRSTDCKAFIWQPITPKIAMRSHVIQNTNCEAGAISPILNKRPWPY